VEEEVAKIVGNVSIGKACSNKVGVGHIRHLDYGQITLGVMHDPTGITDKMRQIANDFASAGISMELAEDLLLGRWKNCVEYSIMDCL